jgi:VWFA-related protein
MGPVFTLLVSAVCLSAQSPAPAPQGDLVAIDFLAVGATGDPVTDLTADQITLRVSGKSRTIKTLQFRKMDQLRATDEPRSAVAVEPPYGTNLLPDANARTLVIVVEDESLEPGREAAMREAVAMLLRGLSARDRVALVTVPHGGLKVDFTTDREKVRAALWQITGQASRNERGDDASCRSRDTIQALTGLLDDLAGGHGPTTVLFFSSGLTGTSPMVLPPPGVAGQQQPLIGRCVLLPEVFQQVGSAAETARANFYIVPHDNHAAITPRSLEGLENLAGVTGGVRLGMASAAEIALSRVARESAGYYVATFMPEPAERNGLNHRVDVRVARPGVSVRTRPGLRIPKPALAAAALPPTAARDMLRERRTHRELPLRVAGYVARQGGEGLRIVALAEPVEPGLTLTAAAIGLFDAKGQLVAQWSAQSSDLSKPLLQSAMVVPPGTYRLRASATDAAGRRGTADYTVDANLTPAGALRLSSLVLGLSRDGQFLPRLQFGAEASAIVQLEIYGGKAGTPIVAMLDVSDSSNGKAMAAMRLIAQGTGEPDRFIAKGIIPLGALPEGDFVVRAIVEMEGQPAGRVIRTIRKQIR